MPALVPVVMKSAYRFILNSGATLSPLSSKMKTQPTDEPGICRILSEKVLLLCALGFFCF